MRPTVTGMHGNKHTKQLCCNRALKPRHFSWCRSWSQRCAALAAPVWDPGSRKSALCCYGCRAAPLTWNSWSNQTHSFPVFKNKIKISRNFRNILDFIYLLLRQDDFHWHFIVLGGCIYFPKIVTELTYLILGVFKYPFKFQILSLLLFFFLFQPLLHTLFIPLFLSSNCAWIS